VGHYNLYFAQAYGTGDYSSCTYSEGQTTGGVCASGSTGAGNSSGGLADTGIAIAVIVTLACLLVFVALLVRIWRRKPVLQEAAGQDDQAQADRNQSDKI
jgi:hypothetical protein